MRVVAFAAALLTAASAVAQTPAAGQPKELEQVTVTATKVAQTLEKAPASITVLGEEFLRERSVSGFQEASEYSANVTMNVSGSAGQFVIRGLGTPDTNLGFDPSVGTVVDGVYYGRANFLSAFFNDVDRYEILRGPQGTLFGKNSTAGLFNVVTNRPGRKLAFDGEVLNRGYGDFIVRPALSIPINEDFGIRLSGNFQNGDTNTLYNTKLKRFEENEEVNGVRLRARYATPSGISLDFSAVRSRYTQNNSNFQLIDISQAMTDTIRRYDPDYDDNFDHRRNSTDYPGAEKSLITSTAMTLDVPLPERRPSWENMTRMLESRTPAVKQVRAGAVEDPARFTLGTLFLIVTAASVALAFGSRLPRATFAGVSGAAAFFTLFAAKWIRRGSATMQMAWYVLLGIYVLASVFAALGL